MVMRDKIKSFFSVSALKPYKDADDGMKDNIASLQNSGTAVINDYKMNGFGSFTQFTSFFNIAFHYLNVYMNVLVLVGKVFAVYLVLKLFSPLIMGIFSQMFNDTSSIFSLILKVFGI